MFAPKQTNAKAAGSKQGLVAWRQVQDDGRSVDSVVHLPWGYTICALTKDFQEYAANPVARDQKRWEMYALIFLFMSSGDPPFHNAAQAVQALPELRLNKHYLGKLKKLFGDSKLPWECPAEFRVGRTPRASLSQAELEDVLLFCEVEPANWLPLDHPTGRRRDYPDEAGEAPCIINMFVGFCVTVSAIFNDG